MGIKRILKKWLSTKVSNLLEINGPVRIQNTNQVLVGKDVFHNGNFDIRGNGKIKIGSFCAFGKDVKLITSNHKIQYRSIQYSFYKKYFKKLPTFNVKDMEGTIEIGNDVWIGDNVIILQNVKIGNGACIGAGAVVVKNVKDYAIVGGVPAKLLKYRFSEEERKSLLEKKWWEWSDDKIKKNKDFFFEEFI